MSKRTRRSRNISQKVKEEHSNKILNRRNLVISFIVGITVILAFIIELPKKINESIKVFATSTPTITPTPLAFSQADNAQTLIIVADFENRSDGQSIGVDPAQYIFEELRKKILLENLPVRVERLFQTVNDNSVKTVGETYHANLVLWGWYDTITINPRLERISNLELPSNYYNFQLEQSNLRFDISDPAQIKISVITDLPSYSSYIVLYTLGMDRYIVGQFADALTYFDSALSAIPVDATVSFKPSEVYFFRGGIYYLQKNFDSAAIDFSKYLELNPDSEYGYNARGVIYAKQGLSPNALSDFTKSLEINPRFSTAYSNRGLSYYYDGNYGDAIHDFNIAIQLDPDDILVYLNRGSAYQALGENDLALSDYNRILEINPVYVAAFSNRGSLYAEKGNYKLALADFTRALELAPNFESLYYNRGLTFYHKGDYDLAIQDFNSAIELNPNSADSYFNRGVVYVALRDRENAIADFNKVLEISNMDDLRQEAEEALKKLGVK